jgi:hypothetical protein
MQINNRNLWLQFCIEKLIFSKLFFKIKYKMKFALIICTYMSKFAFSDYCNLLLINLYTWWNHNCWWFFNTDTNTILNKIILKNIQYYLVTAEHRGLTKQRNYGVRKVSEKWN